MDFPNVVWKEMCEYLSPVDIKNIRLTCKSWGHATSVLDRLFSSTQVSLENCVELVDLEKLSFTHSNVRIFGETVLEDYVQFVPFPSSFENLKNVNIECKFTMESLFSLLNKASASLTSLTLDCSFYSSEVNSSSEISLQPLKELRKFISRNRQSNHEDWLKKIVEASPNLTLFESLPDYPCLAFKFLCEENKTMLRKIRKVQIQLPFLKPENVSQLKNMKLQIQDVTLYMNTFECLLPLLNGDWRKVIKKLTIKEWDPRFLEQHRSFPKLEMLNHLTLVSQSEPGGLYYYKEANFKGSLEILTNLPSLKSLSLQITSFPNVFPRNATFTSSLESLQVVQFALPTNLIESMARMFVNLKKLDIFDMSNAALLLICQHLKSLEILRLGASISDFGITAIPSRSVLKVQHGGQPAEHFRQSPGYFIGSLPNLRKIIIVSRKITDASVILGLIYCKKLTSITIEKPALSDESLIALADADQLRLQGLDLIIDRKITSTGLEYFKRKRPDCHVFLHYYTVHEGIVFHNIGLHSPTEHQ